MLPYYNDVENHNLIFKSEPKSTTKVIHNWNIKPVKEKLSHIGQYLFFAHAILGCDTTSRLHGISKGVALKKPETDLDFVKVTDIFLKSNSSMKEVIEAGEKAMILLFSGKTDS